MAKLVIPRGDARAYTLKLPVAKYESGCELFFGAKKTIDADITDAAAVAKVKLTDADIIDQDSQYVHYSLRIPPSETNDAAPGTYKAEVQFVAPNGDPTTYKQFELQITGDVNRRTS